MSRAVVFIICAGVAAASLGVTGCGARVYEERLEVTKDYYDFVDRLNQNLGAQATHAGVSLRTPIQFRKIPKPPRRRSAASSEGETSETQDPRLPAHVNFELPGLSGVWQANLRGVTDGEKGYIYLLSNYEEWRAFKTPRQIADPGTLYERMRESFVTGLPVQINDRPGTSATRINSWYTETVPAQKDERFVPRKEITAITLRADENSQTQASREYQVYLLESGDIKSALIFDLPRDVSMGENMHERILMSLQTMNVSSEKPRGAGGQAAGGAGEATSAPSSSGAQF